ncbi:hypothetical protein ACJ8S7_005062 [Klebsiella pneumoniae]|nr:hypothetical protein [Klebsiella pneumoniae]
MAKLSNEEILSIIGSELSNATGSSENDSIQQNRQRALAMYLGEKGEVQEGRSSVVSTDVADSIEWIMPEVMKAFTQNNEVVTFDPVGPEDRRQAEIESRYVYDTIIKDNEGFIAMHEFFKDALLQKNGFFKVFYNDTTETQKVNFTGLTVIEFEMLQAEPFIEITGVTENVIEVEGGSIQSFDVNAIRTIPNGKIELMCVAPEDIRVNRMHNSVSLKNARFIAHSMLKTRSELIEDGYSRDVIDELPTEDIEFEESKNYRFAMQGENITPLGSVGDKSQCVYEVSECYIMMDIDDDGIAERCKITVAGVTNPTHILDIEEVDEWPFISATAILMPHKLFGLSIYDRLKEIQQQKTALLRNVLDNVYLQNNQRTAAIEGQVNLDDLLISRPGGVVRVKTPNSIVPITTPPLSGDAYKMFDYLDGVRAGRSGVSPEGTVGDQAIGDSVGSEGLERILNQKEELVGLMVRVFAETGIKPLCEMVRRLLIKHVDTTVDYEFHQEWVQINPAQWKTRNKTTVRVGTGSGNRKEQAAAVMQILGFQEKILANPSQSLVTESKVFAALNDFCKLAGMPGAAAYFLDPNSPEGQQNKQQVDQSLQQQQKQEAEQQQLLAQVQIKIANAEESKAQTQRQNVELTHQKNMLQQQLDQQKLASDNAIKALQQQLAEAKELANSNHKDQELEYRYYDTDTRAETERMRIAATANKQSGETNGTKSTS